MQSTIKVRKYVNVFIVILFFITMSTSCNNDNEPEITPLTIHRHFKTEILQLKLSDIDKFSEYKDNLFIVNSTDEIPEDKHFGIEPFQEAHINYSDFSLIIVYQLLLGDIKTFKYKWSYNNWFERYEFNMTYDVIKGSEYVDIDNEVGSFSYTRCAFIVPHISSNSTWTISSGMFVN